VHSHHLLILCVFCSDLKSANIGFDESGTVKIFDFGIARDMRVVAKSGKPLGFAGTPRYMASEIIAGSKGYDLSADVYSFGILLWEIATCRDPYESIVSLTQLRRHAVIEGRRPPVAAVRNASLRKLIDQCWDPNPQNRPSMTEVCRRLDDICIGIPTDIVSCRGESALTSLLNKSTSLEASTEISWSLTDVF
jgi:serine/threonine protein kinase